MNEHPMNTPPPLDAEANKDPITGTHGSHPIGTGVGAASVGAVAGATAGAIGGPIGAVAGAAIGAVVGGLAGKAAAEFINPTVETQYWREAYSSRPYADSAYGYDHFAPAYRFGWESYQRRGTSGQTFENIEGELRQGWEHAKGTSRLTWDKAKSASRDAWDRAHTTFRSGTDSSHAADHV